MGKRKLVLREISDPRVLAAMEAVPRERFVPAQYAEDAYGDHPLPIGYGQTISQPYIVALMTQLLELKGHEKVLEVGAGSGYQAAILSLLAREVYTVERIPQLAEKARQRLRELGYHNVYIRVGDGYEGWPEHAPYDAIIVTCAAEEIPPPLVEQLADGGRLVIPVGESGWSQRLMFIRKRGTELEKREVAGVVFVPLVRGVARPPENAGGQDEP
ncbi:MAG: protein-L-isoaspartate(D-aspartate) O-methyltransferase [Anaerolineales bacterium]